MAAAVGTWKVHYGFEVSGKLATEVYCDIVQAPDSSYNSLNTVLVTNNARQKGPGKLAIYAVQNVGPAGVIA